MSYGFGNGGNSKFEQNNQPGEQQRRGGQFTNGLEVGNQMIDPSTYKQFVGRATRMGYNINQFLQLRDQTLKGYGVEPEYYIEAKKFADYYKVDIMLLITYLKKGVTDLRVAIQDLMNRGLIINSAVEDNSSFNQDPIRGVEEVNNVQIIEDAPVDNFTPQEIKQINIPESVLNPSFNENCNPQNIPIVPAKDPANNPNTYNQEPLQKIGDALTPQPEPVKKEIKEPVKYSDEVLALSQKYQIHPDTLLIIEKNAKPFKGINLEEYIQLAIGANREGISVLEYYTIYMKNNNKEGSAINSKIRKEAKETDIIIGDLLTQAEKLQNAQAQTTGSTDGRVAYGQSKLDNKSVSEGGFIGSTNICETTKQTAYGNGLESRKESVQVVFGGDKDVKSGKGRPAYGNETSGVKSRDITFGTN